MQQSISRPAASRQRPRSVTILAILATIGGVGIVLGVLAGAFVIHGLDSLNASDAIIVLPGLALAALYLAFAYAAWTLRPWGWSTGVAAAAASIVYTTAILAYGWADLMADGPPMFVLIGLIVLAVAAGGLLLWFHPNVKAAFGRA